MVRSRNTREFSTSSSGVMGRSRVSSVSHKASIHGSTDFSIECSGEPPRASSDRPMRSTWLKTLRRLASVGCAVRTGSMRMERSRPGQFRGREDAAGRPAESPPQRHGSARLLLFVLPQPADALPLLAEVDQVEKEAEGVRNV